MELQQIVSTEFEKICLNKFLISIKDEFTERFNNFMKNNKEKIIKEIEMVEKNNNPEKKKRGRPKKNKPDEKEIENLKIDGNELEKEPEIQPKKKRGRPKKVKQDDIIISVNDTDDDSFSNMPLKKKGRPAIKDQHNIIEVNIDKEPVCDIQEIDVVRIDIDGDIYLRDTYNNLYNMSDQEPVGKYDELNNAIIV